MITYDPDPHKVFLGWCLFVIITWFIVYCFKNWHKWQLDAIKMEEYKRAEELYLHFSEHITYNRLFVLNRRVIPLTKNFDTYLMDVCTQLQHDPLRRK